MIKTLFSSLFGFAAIVVSFALSLTYAFNSTVLNPDFYDNKFDESVHLEITENLAELFKDDNQLVVFPDSVNSSVDSQKMAEVLLE